MLRAALVAAAIAAAFPSHAAEGCKPLETYIEAAPSGTEFHPLNTLQTAGAVAFFNAVPPASKVPFDFAVIADMADGSGFLLVGFGIDICATLKVAPTTWPKVRAGLIGNPT